MPDTRLADARRVMLDFAEAGSACSHLSVLKKKDAVGSLALNAVAFPAKAFGYQRQFHAMHAQGKDQ